MQNKEGKGLVSSMRMDCTATAPHFFEVCLWKDYGAFNDNTEDDMTGAGACCEVSSYYQNDITGNIKAPRRLGTIHFVVDHWGMEVVAHELFHALVQRLRCIDPPIASIIRQKDDAEESIAYEFGKWSSKVYNWLWDNDPSKHWERKK